MGQLEVYNINEIYLNGIIISLFINYLAEELESTTFESYKAYIYSSNLALKKNLSYKNFIVTPGMAIYKSWSSLNLLNKHKNKMTKTIEEFSIWQDNFKIEVKIDENILKMKRKYNI